MKKPNVLIIGYYGSHNIGDEVLLEATIKLLNTVYDSPKITAITYNVQDTIQKRKIDGVSRNKFFQILKAIRNSDVVVGGGGSMLQNITSNRSLVYYLTILWISKLMGKKVALLGNGIGPLRTSFSQSITKYVLKTLDAIVLRDIDSYNLLKTFDLKNIYLGNDLVFTMNQDIKLAKTDRKILINLRKWHYDDSFIQTMIGFIEYLIKGGFNVTLIPFQVGNDDLLLMDIYNKINLPGLSYFDSTEYDDMIKEISSSELFISMRLHGLIFSSICDTPFIGLSYDPKVTVFSENQEQECFVDLDSITLSMLISKFNHVYDNLNDYKKKLGRNTKDIIKLNHIHTDVLEMLLND